MRYFTLWKDFQYVDLNGPCCQKLSEQFKYIEEKKIELIIHLPSGYTIALYLSWAKRLRVVVDSPADNVKRP